MNRYFFDGKPLLKILVSRNRSSLAAKRVENLCKFATYLDKMGQVFAREVECIEFEMLCDPALCAPEVVAKLVWIQGARNFMGRASGRSGLIH